MYAVRACQGDKPGAAAHGAVGSHGGSSALSAGTCDYQQMAVTPLMGGFLATLYQCRCEFLVNILDKGGFFEELLWDSYIRDDNLSGMLRAGIKDVAEFRSSERDGNAGHY